MELTEREAKSRKKISVQAAMKKKKEKARKKRITIVNGN